MICGMITQRSAYLGTFLLFQTDAHNYKIVEILKQLKFQLLPPPCTAHLHNRLVRRRDIDQVSNDDERIESYL